MKKPGEKKRRWLLGGTEANCRRTVGQAAAAAAAACLTFLTLYAIEQPVRDKALAKLRVEVHTAASVPRARLERELTAVLEVTRGLGTIIALDGVPDDDRFASIVTQILRSAPHIRLINVTEGTVIRRVWPRRGNESTLGVDYRDLSDQWPLVERAMRTGLPVLAGPVQLVQGGTALVQRTPVVAAGTEEWSGAFLGLLNLVVDVNLVLSAAGIDAPDLGVTIALRGLDDNGEPGTMIWGDSALFNGTSVLLHVSLPGGVWQMAAAPPGGWTIGSPLFDLVRGLEVVAALLAGIGMFGLLRHRQHRNEAIERLRASEARLKRSNEELEQFATIASHDLQEPLRQIASPLQLLQRRYKGRLDADADTFIDFAVEGAKRMQQQILDFLDYSRVSTTPLSPERVDTAATLAEVRAALADHEAATHAHLTVGPLPIVRGDSAQIATLFAHVLRNAMDYRHPDKPADIRINAVNNGDAWHFTVADRGIGIAAEFHDRVFQFFRRLTPPDGAASGIGLPLCRRIVERHEGRMWIDSAAGQGTTVHFTLPMVSE
ncbi:MAG: ATP-binding protein [Rhodospirillaceae bacterium]